MRGRIIKGIAGFYYVHAQGHGVWECRARGGFRNQKIKPYVGDMVAFDVIDEEQKTGNIISILPRLNTLQRPAVANVDQAMVIFALTQPEPNLGLLDRFLVAMRMQDLRTVICFNKLDIAGSERAERLAGIYAKCGSDVLLISVKNQTGLEAVRDQLRGHTTVLAGPSGVGKSSLMNELLPEAGMATGDVSEKIQRGRHTTRHSELFYLGEQTYLMDTPGFTSLYLQDMDEAQLRDCFMEFAPYEGKCRFAGCAHIHEPDCAVKAALEAGEINRRRYQSYVGMYEEIKSQRKY